MKNLLTNFSVYYDTYDDFQRKIDQLQRAIESPEWAFYKEHILVIKSQMANNLLSTKFTNMSSEEKDIIQKAYYQLNQILDYMDSPLKWFKHRNRFKQVTSNLKSKVKPS